MLKETATLLILILICLHKPVLAQQIQIPTDFSKQSFNHIVNISNFGIHSAGTVEEKKVSEYIFTELSNLGVETHVEEFNFKSFEISEIDLEINQRKTTVHQICFNPYYGKFHFHDDFILLNSDNTTSKNITDKIVVAAHPLDNTKYFQLFFQSPKLVLVLPVSEIQKLEKESKRELKCTVKGVINSYTSQNVVAQLPSKQFKQEEVILSAHYDSYPGSVGADDNGSGVGVLIELARYFKNNPTKMNLKFVFFGGEEKGLLGSRAYLNRNFEDLKNCRLLFNIDQVGGEHIFIETTGGVNGVPKEKGNSQFPAFMKNKSLEGIESNWRLLAPEVLPLFEISNRPEWLANTIRQSINELSIPVSYAGNTGSDQMTFAQAGIVATAIGTMGNDVHCPKDIPSQIKKQSLENCGKIIIDVILKTVNYE
uniref:M28 family metallopeptidase n=1 Tax=uncultured Draconibacterium sp. TaxID=1573823 RepID=UPI0032175115